MLYPCIITQIFSAAEVQEIPGLDEMTVTTNITNPGQIRDPANPMTRKARRTLDMFRKNGQAKTEETASVSIQVDGQAKATQTMDRVGTSSALPLVQFVPPRLRGMPDSLMMISQSMQTKAILRLGMLEAKVNHLKGGVKPQIDAQMAIQDKRV